MSNIALKMNCVIRIAFRLPSNDIINENIGQLRKISEEQKGHR